MSVSGNTPGVASRRQKRMGPAPFASFEDLSDELESPEDKNAAGSVVRLPGIREDATPTPSNTPAPIDQRTPEFTYAGISLVGATACVSSPSTIMSSQSSTRSRLQTPSTPRIDISRASSSSHHDSKESTPERELFEGHDAANAKLGLGFREEGALDLRSSTEELDFQDLQENKRKGKARPQSPCLHDESLHHQRKDSQSSELGLLSISGRTSRLSSIGSQGSGHSRLSNASHLSVISGHSGLSRSPSPHKMLLETSFCGTKPPGLTQATAESQGTKVESEVLEKVLLSRKLDPTEAVLAEGISVTVTDKNSIDKRPVTLKKIDNRVQSVKSDITIKVDEPSTVSNNSTKIPSRIVSKSGVEYIYIPLKGPLPLDKTATTTTASSSAVTSTRVRTREVKSATTVQSKNPIASKQERPRVKSANPSPLLEKKEDEPKYIRIKLKPDYMYSQEGSSTKQKPDTLDLNRKSPNLAEVVIQKDEGRLEQPSKPQDPGKSLSSTPSASPKLSRHTFLRDSNVGSKTPSPSLSRKSSFASLFRSKETIISPESPTMPGFRRKNTITGILRDAGDSLRDRSRSRSKSSERDKSTNLSAAPSSTESIDSRCKQKSVFSIFKGKKDKTKNDLDTSSSEVLPSIEGIAKVEFKFNDTSAKADLTKYFEPPLEGNSIRIPLHSPTHYDDRGILQDLKTSSQDSQDTVIDVSAKKIEAAVIEPVPQIPENNTKAPVPKQESTKRQGSTSSENVVFSTQLGNNDEVFTTKLPKDRDKTTKDSTSETNGLAIEIKEQTECKMTQSPSVSVDTTTTEESCSTVKLVDKVSLDLPSNRNSVISSAADDDRYSSESERDSEIEFVRNKKDLDLKLSVDYVEPERKGLVLQQDSYEDELPYIPTTLPQEKSAAVPIIPIKQRSTFEMKTYPIERPRSTTPINPSCLEEYCEEVMGAFNSENVTKTIEKLKISLPKNDSIDKPLKSPRKAATNTNWFEFAEKGISKGRRSSLTQENDTPPPLPPKGIQKEWINFEEIPERRKPPKRIQTLPSRGHIDVPDSVLQDNIVYNYVNPEECKCECHEITAREREKRERAGVAGGVQEDELPLLEDEQVEDDKNVAAVVERITLEVGISDRTSVVSDSSVDFSASVEPLEANGIDLSLRTPFTSDLGVTSNRSSIVLQDEEPQSPDPGSPNAFPKTF